MAKGKNQHAIKHPDDWVMRGADSKVPRADWQVISELAVKIPRITEQQKIARLLTNSDKNIELLQQQFADLKQEKIALMQQLLIGKRKIKLTDQSLKVICNGN